ncbi:hypothetical protein Mapa_009120 [Marchantia paleacea]|nr:hypothetical protein Mapa_009120 [Marchantia paleacea]
MSSNLIYLEIFINFTSHFPQGTQLDSPQWISIDSSLHKRADHEMENHICSMIQNPPVISVGTHKSESWQ